MSAGFGWVALENAAIEVETDGRTAAEILSSRRGFAGGLFHQGVVVGNDQHFVVDGMTDEGERWRSGVTWNFCSNMVYLRGDQGAAPVAYLHHLEADLQCSGNGVRSVAGNTLDVQDSVIQGTSQYAVYYAGGLQPWSANLTIFTTKAGRAGNPVYPSSLVATAGYISER